MLSSFTIESTLLETVLVNALVEIYLTIEYAPMYIGLIVLVNLPVAIFNVSNDFCLVFMREPFKR